jgi:hypothetical protein
VSRHLLAIGRRVPGSTMNDFIMDAVDERVSRLGELLTARCDSPTDLLRFVEFHGQGRNLIDRLDIFDHGGPGHQWLGNETLFRSSSNRCDELEGLPLATLLKPHLSECAQVRLLGCLTATAAGVEGRMLLVKLSRALGGHRVVFGTIDNVDEADFGANGFEPFQESGLLYSSFAALDYQPPTAAERTMHLGELSTVLCI